jgi:hypothetical protein
MATDARAFKTTRNKREERMGVKAARTSIPDFEFSVRWWRKRIL